MWRFHRRIDGLITPTGVDGLVKRVCSAGEYDTVRDFQTSEMANSIFGFKIQVVSISAQKSEINCDLGRI